MSYIRMSMIHKQTISMWVPRNYSNIYCTTVPVHTINFLKNFRKLCAVLLSIIDLL